MIREIHICDEASYSSEGAKLSGLAKVNYVYGANGSGKTTISRVIANPSNYSSCIINPRETSCQTFVYNRDFVKDHFNPDKKLKGIFTLGDGNDQIIESIDDKKAIETRLLSDKEKLTGSLTAERDKEAALEKEFEDYCWEFKKKYDESFKDAFTGLRNSASKFKERFLQEALTNNSELISHEKLVEKAKTVFSDNQTKELIHPLPDASNLIKIESLDALAKKIIGKRDVDIASMIERLGNSDWVKEGRQYLKGTDDHCPFCQQEINAAFAKSLEEYFDDNFENGVSELRTIATNYEAYSSSIIAQMNDILAKANRFLDATAFKQLCDALETKIKANKMHLGQKLKEPSTIIALEAINEIISHIYELISGANQKASEHNRLIDNISSEKKSLIGCVWRFVLSEANIGYTAYQQKSTDLKRAIQGIEAKLSAKEQDIKNNTDQLQALERSITSVQPTIDKINGLLGSFGFTNFKLAKAEKEGFYQIIRGDGVDVGDTLSEGEKSFITFLYFYHLLKGSSTESGTVSDRIVVIDDPVSSLDSDVLFIVSNLIKGLIRDIHKNIGHIKQVFIRPVAKVGGNWARVGLGRMSWVQKPAMRLTMPAMEENLAA